MKHTLLSTLLSMLSLQVWSQEQAPLPDLEQQLENQAMLTESEQEDDSWWQQAAYYRRHPLNLNTATAVELEALPLLNVLSINALLRHRSLMGKLVSVYELQVIPGWAPEIIRQLMPYITIGDPEKESHPWSRRLTEGDYSLLLRATRVLEKAKGYDKDLGDKEHYLGDPYALFTRYRYNYRNLLQYGVTAEKDAGEPFFQGQPRRGFDFYSFHWFVRKMGVVKSLALGDYTVNMGQGLIHWQSLAFKKSSAVLQVKRQSEVLKPYNASGEYNFHRGAGITLQSGRWQATFLGSYRKLDANLVMDSAADEQYISSLQTYGLHRTPGEMENRHRLEQLTVGANLRYTSIAWQVGVNALQYKWSYPFHPSAEPYDLYGMNASQWSNYSVDYNYTFRNIHMYGEVAVDKKMNKAFLQGMLMSLHPKVDMAIVYRNIARNYQAVYGNALTENYAPSNERGLYTGISIRPAVGWQLDVYVHLFHFPWLRYRVNAPGEGSEYLAQILYTPNKRVELLGRYRYEQKPINEVFADPGVRPVTPAIRHNWRWQAVFQADDHFTWKNRVELVWYKQNIALTMEKGFSAYTELFYKSRRSFSANLRLQYFETDSYDAGIYAYEQDVQYSFSIPLFQGKGVRYYVNLKKEFGKLLQHKHLGKMKATCWLRFARSIGDPDAPNGNGLEEINTPHKTSVKVQWILEWIH